MGTQFIIPVLASILILGALGYSQNVFADTFTETQKVFPDAEFIDDLIDDFGFSVAIDGNTTVVGSPNDDFQLVGSTGAAYIYERNSEGKWVQVQVIGSFSNPDDALFGNSVAISGDTIVVGARFEGNFQGAAYIFEKGVGGWPATETKRILASDIENFDTFGTSVDISGDTVIVGSLSHNVVGFGAVYIFEKGAGGWPATETKKNFCI